VKKYSPQSKMHTDVLVVTLVWVVVLTVSYGVLWNLLQLDEKAEL